MGFMNRELALTNACIVTPHESFNGSILSRDGRIAEVQPGPLSLPDAIDCEGDYLIPGLVDLHTDNFERLIRPRNSVEWPVLPSVVAHDAHMVSAGITTIFDSLYVGFAGFGTRSFETLQKTIAELEIGTRERILRGDHFLHLRCETSMEEMPAQFATVYPHPRVLLVSFMDHTPGQRQWRDLEKYVAMEKRDFHLTEEEIARFLESAEDRHRMLCGPNREKLLAMVDGHGLALASHDDTTEDHVEQAHAEGITISEFPTTLEAAEAARRKGMKTIAGSPNLVLGRSHSGNVSALDLASRGLLDALASDYVPSSLLHGAFLLHERLAMPLHQAIAMITRTPAQMTGLDDRGAIEAGRIADLVRVRVVRDIPIATIVWREGLRVA
jgi:alpha-D-ribose 1-methylphosphonate 5-triphosphate diphosphatase